jgi:hypothetical protein
MSDSRPLILWLAPWYPPDHGGGAEQAAHAFNRYLIDTRNVRVIVASANLPAGRFEGVEIETIFTPGRLRALVDEADVMCAQLSHEELAAHLAARARKPTIHFVHNTFRAASPYRPDNPAPQYVAYNSEWVRDALGFPMPSIDARPPVDWRHYQVQSTRECITLVNVRADKGGDVFLACARRMPHRRFLGSMGFLPAPEPPALPNVEYRPFARDVRGVYARTGVLLMPSEYESWGRVGIEAMASGIPVIAHPTPGLRESLGPAGIFCDRDRVDEWIAAIEMLDDPENYEAQSRACLDRAKALEPADDLERVGAVVDACLAYRPPALV